MTSGRAHTLSPSIEIAGTNRLLKKSILAFFNPQNKKRGFCFASFFKHLRVRNMAVHPYTAPQAVEKRVFQQPANRVMDNNDRIGALEAEFAKARGISRSGAGGAGSVHTRARAIWGTQSFIDSVQL
jgi:hypothetical protein